MSAPISQFDSSIINQASTKQPRTRPSKDEQMNQLTNYLKNRINCDQENGSILTTNDLKEKLKNLLEETEKLENGEQNVLVDRGYEKARQCANQTLKRADEELHSIKEIRQEQENIKKQMFLSHQDLKKNKAEILILEEQQNTLLQGVKNIKESFNKVNSNFDLLALELKNVSNDFSKIKVDQKKITEKFDELHKSVQDIPD